MASTQLLPVSVVKNLLFTCLEYGNKLKQMDYATVKTALELIIKDTSLTMYCAEEDDDMATTPIDQGLLVDAEKDIVSVTISGAIYIIDILIQSNSGAVSKVSLAASSTSTNEKANEYLTSLLTQSQFIQFEKAVKLICFLDSFNAPEQLDLLTLLSGMEADLQAIYKIELGKSKTVEKPLFFGHGYPRLYKDNLGVSIVYYTFSSSPHSPLQASFVSTTSTLDQSKYFLALVSLEGQVGEGAPSNSFIPKSKSQCVITTSSPTSSIPPKDQLLYEICPMPVFDSSSSSSSKTERTVQVYTPSSLIPGKSPSSFPETTAQLSFVLDLLPHVQIGFVWAQRLKTASNGTISIPVIETPWNQRDTFESLYLAGLSDESPVCNAAKCKTPLFYLDQIRFSHISQVYEILKSLRQVVVFNKLAQSIFTPTSGEISKPLFKTRLLNWNPPESFQFILMHKRPPFRFSLELVVDLNGIISVNIGQMNATNMFEPLILAPVEDGFALKEAIDKCQGLDIIRAVQQALLI